MFRAHIANACESDGARKPAKNTAMPKNIRLIFSPFCFVKKPPIFRLVAGGSKQSHELRGVFNLFHRPPVAAGAFFVRNRRMRTEV
jgi:hypothetical protein